MFCLKCWTSWRIKTSLFDGNSVNFCPSEDNSCPSLSPILTSPPKKKKKKNIFTSHLSLSPPLLSHPVPPSPLLSLSFPISQPRPSRTLYENTCVEGGVMFVFSLFEGDKYLSYVANRASVFILDYPNFRYLGTCDLMNSVSNWYGGVLDVWFVLGWPCRVDKTLKSNNQLTPSLSCSNILSCAVCCRCSWGCQ